MTITRKQFLKTSVCAAAGVLLPANSARVITVNGPILPAQMGITLVHEHILVDFVGAEKISAGRYDFAKVLETALPFLKLLRSKGCQTLIDCTPAYLGRDVRLLQQLSKDSGLHIITNTGWYGAANEKFLPARIQQMSARDIAKEWILEFTTGIDGTPIRPGFMKLGLDGIPFSDPIHKILEAAVITYKTTGLPIAIHTSKGGDPALEQMKYFESEKLPLSSWVWIHAQNEKNLDIHIDIARKGGWISFDNISRDNAEENLSRLIKMKAANLLNKVLISHDAGWYDVEDASRNFRGFTDIFDHFIPLLQKNKFTTSDINQLVKINPATVFTIRN